MTPTTGSLEARIGTLAEWMFEAKRLVVFTGAGISTESGLPDFRGPDGLWTRKDKGLPPKPAEKDWPSVDPNEGHLAIVELQTLGRLDYLISQNVDSLHLKSGIRPELLAELHGNITLLRCASCQKTHPNSSGLDRCVCGGRLGPSVVHFGDTLPFEDLNASYEHSRGCDLFIVLGSSLFVSPAADMPRVAMEAGAKLVIINQEPTPFDRAAHLLFKEKIGEVFPAAVRKLKESMSRSSRTPEEKGWQVPEGS